MLKLLVKSAIKPGYWEKAAPLYKELIAETLKEKGCIEYELFVDTADEHSCYLIETWESEADLAAHQASEHVRRIVPLLGECRPEKPELLF